MSGINPILTQVATGSTSQAAGAQALAGGATGVFSAGGANFFELILANLVASEDGTATGAKTTGLTNTVPTTTPQKTPDAKASVIPKGENPLAALQVALATQTLDADGNIVVAPVTAESTGSLQTQLDVTNQIINHLKNILPENAQQEGVFNKILAKLQTKSDTLQASLSALEGGVITKDTAVEDIPLPLLISLGLNPAQINEATQKIQDLEQKLGRDITVEDLIAGVGGIVPPAPQQTVSASLQVSAKAVAPAPVDLDAATDAASQPTDDLAAQLNALDVGGEDIAPNSKQSNKEGLETSGTETNTEADANSLIPAKANTTDSILKKDTAAFKENLVNLINSHNNQNTGLNTPDNNLTFPVQGFSSDAEAAIYAQYGLSPTVSTSLGSTAQAASLISSPTIAGQNHPATQLVAATMIKSAKDGSDQTIMIRLDPPELGNVSVRLQFGKDKSVKALISAEKPETFMMLQRDAHSLERALQSVGLDTAATDAISFELAQDNGTFNPKDGDSANNGRSSSSAGAIDVGGEDILQSSVTWQVDPSTGHVRYNIFA